MQKNYKKKNNNATIVSILLGAEVVQCALIHTYIIRIIRVAKKSLKQ